jgi:hypothetical protein
VPCPDAARDANADVAGACFAATLLTNSIQDDLLAVDL